MPGGVMKLRWRERVGREPAEKWGGASVRGMGREPPCSPSAHSRLARVGQDGAILADYADADLVGGALDAEGEEHGVRVLAAAAALALRRASSW